MKPPVGHRAMVDESGDGDGGSAAGAPSFQTGVIDLAVASPPLTTLVPAKAGKRWRTDQLRVTVFTNTFSVVAAVVNIGTTGPTYTDLVDSGNAFGGATAPDFSYSFPFGANFSFPFLDVDTTPIVINRAVAGTGGVGTVSFQIWGEYI